MKRPFPFRLKEPPSTAVVEPVLDDAVVRRELAMVTYQRHQKQRRRSISLLLLVFGVLFGIIILPDASPTLAHALSGASGGVLFPDYQFLTPTCGHPVDVFKKLGLDQYMPGFPKGMPTQQQLEQLPTPQKKPAVNQGDANYDPSTDQLCAVGWTALYIRFIKPQPSVQGSTNFQPDTPGTGNWVTDILKQLWDSFAQSLGGFLQGLIDWCSSFGFMFITPPALTYKLDAVTNLQGWALGMLDGLVALILVVGGYNALLGRSKDFRELAPRLILATIVANFSLFFIIQFIELENSLVMGVQGAIFTAGAGNPWIPWDPHNTSKFTLPGVFNLIDAPFYITIAYLLELIVALLLGLQMLTRIALLDLLIVLAPFGLLCFALPQTQAWGRLWAQAFVSTLVVQLFQVICIGMGSAMVSGFGHSSLTPVTILVGIAAFFVAFKIPGMLLSNVLSAAGAGGKSGGAVVETVAEVAKMVGA